MTIIVFDKRTIAADSLCTVDSDATCTDVNRKLIVSTCSCIAVAYSGTMPADIVGVTDGIADVIKSSTLIGSDTTKLLIDYLNEVQHPEAGAYIVVTRDRVWCGRVAPEVSTFTERDLHFYYSAASGARAYNSVRAACPRDSVEEVIRKAAKYCDSINTDIQTVNIAHLTPLADLESANKGDTHE